MDLYAGKQLIYLGYYFLTATTLYARISSMNYFSNPNAWELPKSLQSTGRCHCITLLFTPLFRDKSPNIKLDLYVTGRKQQRHD